MIIIINYEASWKNSFLSGSNNEPLPKKGREFIASMSKLADNFMKREITRDTVMGILNRLIGERRPLYRARQTEHYFFKEIEKCIDFKTLNTTSNEEMIFLRNLGGITDANSFTGMIKNNHPTFNSPYSKELWGVLMTDFITLCQFINEPEKRIIENMTFSPITIVDQLYLLNKLKAIDPIDHIKKSLITLQSYFPDAEYLDKKEKIKPVMFYCSALYLQIDRLKKRFNLSSVLTKNGLIAGISKRGFTIREFMKAFSTGGPKIIWGNPYLLKQRIKGQGEVCSMLTKEHGTLEITINISSEKAMQLKAMIENAGVASFFIGKKGLAYIKDIQL
jgi:Cas5fv helical domain